MINDIYNPFGEEIHPVEKIKEIKRLIEKTKRSIDTQQTVINNYQNKPEFADFKKFHEAQLNELVHEMAELSNKMRSIILTNGIE